MTIKISIVFDHQSDVFREIKIDSTSSLQDLHECIVQSFDLEKNEMAAFYLTNIDWEQGQEIPLIAMHNDATEMKDIQSKDIFQSHEKLLYVNNFLVMWRFMIEVVDIQLNETIESPQTLLSFGTMPQESPNIQFVSDETTFSADEDFSDSDFDEFSEYDNYEGY